MKWKRSDISTEQVLAVYARPHEERWPADEVLMAETGAPLKVVWAAMIREDDRGFLDFGTNLRGGWLTDKGKTKLDEIKSKEQGARFGKPHYIRDYPKRIKAFQKLWKQEKLGEMTGQQIVDHLNKADPKAPKIGSPQVFYNWRRNGFPGFDQPETDD